MLDQSDSMSVLSSRPYDVGEHETQISSLALHCKGGITSVLSGSQNGVVQLWREGASGVGVTQKINDTGISPVSSLAFMCGGDGVGGSEEGVVRVWDLQVQ